MREGQPFEQPGQTLNVLLPDLHCVASAAEID